MDRAIRCGMEGRGAPHRSPQAAGLVGAALVVVGPLTGCGDATALASPVGLAELVAEAGEHDSRAVIVDGHVRVHLDPLHH